MTALPWAQPKGSVACAKLIDNPVVARLLGLLVAALFICHYAKIDINNVVRSEYEQEE